MDNQPDDLDEDVVIIEQKDKKSYLYIALAAVLGVAVGGLLGGSMSSQQWKPAYQELESRYHQLEEKMNEERAAATAEGEEKFRQLKAEFEKKLAEEKAGYAEKSDLFQEQMAALKQEKEALETRLKTQVQQINQVTERNDKLNRQTGLQASLFERSRELFQREFKIKQSLESLQKEQDELIKKEKALKKECNDYLEGSSWDARSDACTQQDATNERLGKVRQLIRVHQMDLKQIQSIADELGVD
ncbi:phosphodiesterase [Vibrio aerogenes CECT 7868]|uniref:Phosphodiesterase n=1 Tax=Vibrio aerogenes CECT 7868 TaxID=1216006 RepID=A0A1M5Z7F5_9VIBR|nr:hypothetical protein [Vibrio aerogenes]SHI20121.1 phosphodiesterase [Vibrio aerogenes CECT 7868]